MSELISVVVPVGRVDGPLRAQLLALRGQEIDRPVEFVLARNVADPTAIARLDRIVGELDDDRFRVVDAADVRGASHARNVGAAAAHGDTLAFCDGDDVVRPGWLAAIVGPIATGEPDRLDAAGGRLVDVGLTERQRRARPASTPDALPRWLGVPYIGSGNLAITREAFEHVGGFDEGLVRCEDIALSWQLIVDGYRLGYVSDAVVDYRHRAGIVPMVRQHLLYGRGMGQVLVRFGVPGPEGWRPVHGLALLKPNRQPSTDGDGSGDVAGGLSALGVLRKASLAAGRVWGIAEALAGGTRLRRGTMGR